MAVASALHHNKAKTNLHIHLIFSERQELDVPERKIAARNMFYDENGKQHGDCADAVYDVDGIKVTPRIGGVGLMTRAMLLYNVCVAKYGEHKMESVL